MSFNPKLAVLALAASAAVASFSAQAASIDVKVIGTITPGACTPTMAGGGTIDYGTIGAAELSKTNFTLLPEKVVDFTIRCNAPSKVAIRAVDNRESSVVPGITMAIGSSFPDVYNYGLGAVSGANVGGYAMLMKQGTFTADTKAVVAIRSSNSGTSWSPTTDGSQIKTGTYLTSWASTSTGLPVAFSVLSGSFSVQAVLNKASALPLTANVTLDGSATLELV